MRGPARFPGAGLLSCPYQGKRGEALEKPYITIENPMLGETYCHDRFGVYMYDAPPGSTPGECERRTCLDSYGSEAEARENYPTAVVVKALGKHKVFVPPGAPGWFDPASGETWQDG